MVKSSFMHLCQNYWYHWDKLPFTNTFILCQGVSQNFKLLKMVGDQKLEKKLDKSCILRSNTDRG